jgi:hypothetical protein
MLKVRNDIPGTLVKTNGLITVENIMEPMPSIVSATDN